MNATTLTERYLAAATPDVPESQREEFRRELAERIGDDTEARVRAGVDPAEAEYRTLSELGDPDALVASYFDRRRYLIGPALYPTWKRLLRLLVLIIVPTVAIAFPLAQAIAHRPFGEIIGSTVVTLITVAVHVAFWTTIVFVVLDRNLGDQPLIVWTPDQLPEPGEPRRREVAADFVVNLVFIALLLLGTFGHALFLPFRDDAGVTIPLFQPGTWAWLQWWLLGVAVLGVVFWIMLYRQGRWSHRFAAMLLLPSLAFAVPVSWAVWNARLFNPEFLERAGWDGGAELLAHGGVLAIVFSFLIVIVVAIWPVDAFIKVRRASSGLTMNASERAHDEH